MNAINRKYPLKRQPVDERDAKFAVERMAEGLPDKVDLRGLCPPVYDQGSLGSCTANAGIAAYTVLKQTTEEHARLYLYFMERLIEGNVDEDAGASMRDIGKALQKYGVCCEKTWPYIESKYRNRPYATADLEAAKYKIDAYRAVPSLRSAKALLASGHVVLTGMEVYESFERTGSDGVVPPVGARDQCLGGHAIMLAGYDDHFCKKVGGIREFIARVFGKSTQAETYYLARNSWGDGWGQGGYFWMPESYVRKYCYDMWLLE